MPLKTHLDDEPTLNLTAMLDVMFLLIIFFALGTRFVEAERKIDVEVPKVADRGALSAAPSRKVINVGRDGVVTLDRTPVSLPNLPLDWRRCVNSTKTSPCWCVATDGESISVWPTC